LPEGWEAFTDPASKKIDYWHDASQIVVGEIEGGRAAALAKQSATDGQPDPEQQAVQKQSHNQESSR